MSNKKNNRQLVRPNDGRMIAGVAKGMANYFGIDVAWVRFVWLLLLIPGGVPGVVPYILFWIAIPAEK